MQKLILNAGVTTEATETLAGVQGRWSESNLIRFRDNYIEKMFGWANISEDMVDGIARTLLGFLDANSIAFIAIGSNTRLSVWQNGVIYDITPLRTTTNVAVNLNTVISTKVVQITDASFGGTTGDQIFIVVPLSVGGVTLYGNYTLTLVTANTYTIVASHNATSTVTGGGAVPSYHTNNTTATVNVTFAAHGLVSGNIWTVHVSTTVGGLTLLGDYIISNVATNTFDITAAGNATSTATASENSGNARYQYLIPAGKVSSTTATGYGTGTWGGGPWGVGSGSVFLPLRYWFLDNFSATLIACIGYGKMYTWNSPITNRATLLTQAPSINTAMFIAMPQQQIVSLGAEVLGTQDPLLVRWCDAGVYTDWIASTTNQAGSYRLSRGTRIVGGIQGPLSGLIWTDTDLWQMQYVQPPFIYTFNLVATGMGLISPLAMGILGRNIYWMSQQGFYIYGSGSPSPLPCDVWDTIFQDLDGPNQDKIICATNSHTNEIAWFFPSTSGGTGEIDACVRVNSNGQWDYSPPGTLFARTAWSDGNLQGLPTAVTLDHNLVQHEIGMNDNLSPMTGVHAHTGYLDISEGQQMMLIDQIIPDFKLTGTDPTIEISLHVLDEPTGTPITFGPYTVNHNTSMISILPAARGRQISFEIRSEALNTWWRLGAVRVRTRPSGRRPMTF
jgi:hypothetical protein